MVDEIDGWKIASVKKGNVLRRRRKANKLNSICIYLLHQMFQYA